MKKKSRKFEPKLWTTKEVRRFKRLYPISHNKDLAKAFGRTMPAIWDKARKLGIKKDRTSGHCPSHYWREGIIWTKEAIKVLRKMYINSSNKEIAAKLKLRLQTVVSKINKMKLSQEFKKQGLIRKKMHVPTNGLTGKSVSSKNYICKKALPRLLKNWEEAKKLFPEKHRN